MIRSQNSLRKLIYPNYYKIYANLTAEESIDMTQHLGKPPLELYHMYINHVVDETISTRSLYGLYSSVSTV